VSGDGRGNGEDTTCSGGVGAAACSAMRASMDADKFEINGITVTPPKWVAAEYGFGECYFIDQ
ncbi:hypothetical protein Tco_0636423, partial [Tanacetum coccineum]